MDQNIKTPSTSDLNKWYEESLSIDKRIFAEQRSNVLLYSGDHYQKAESRVWGPIRDNSKIDNSTKIRIVKNHVQKICKIYMDGIVSYAPGVFVEPANESELHDQKVAELNNSVWQHLKVKHKLDEEIENWVHDFIVQGELFVKIAWNKNKGEHVAYHQATNKEGEPQWDDEPGEHNGFTGTPTPGEAIFSGDLEYTRLYSFNMLRDPRSRSIKDSPWLCYQQLIPLEEALPYAEGDPQKEEYIRGSDGEATDYISFDIGEKKYVETKGSVLLREWFFRPCQQYPNGFYIMDTTNGKVSEMELPNGIFPIVYSGFDEMSSTPRHYSIIKVLRPAQAEINRCASKIVEHQITLGDDKVITPLGGKMTQGATLPGIRQMAVAGSNYTVVPGRTGDQYLGWLTASISDMYSTARLPEEEDEQNQNLDAYMLLSRSMKQKKRYSKYAAKFERALKAIAEVSLATFKYYVSDDALIPVIGRSEQVNIDEFRDTMPMYYQISLIEQSDDTESKLGKMLQQQNLLQYAGSNLSKPDLGRLMRTSPYANKEQLFSDWTTDYDNVTADILALDRGKYPMARKFDDHEYQVKTIETRMTKTDFQFLHPFIQGNYQKKLDEHNAIIAQQLQQTQLAASGFIPADGPLTPVDMYVQDPSSPAKTQRARVPLGALLWLIKKLESQGVQQSALVQLSQGGQAELASHLPPPPPTTGGQAAPGAAPMPGSQLGNLQQPYLSQPGGAHV